MNKPLLCDLPGSALTARLYEIRNTERELLVEFLQYLGEVDRRRLYLELAFSSLFAFCTDHLGLTKSTAFRRTTAARLLDRFPGVGAHLADGRLCLTTFVELRDILCDERLQEILDRAAGRTEEQVKELVAAMRPRPAPMDLLRRLPAPAASPLVHAGPAPAAARQLALEMLPAATQPLDPRPAPPPRPARIEPISEELRTLRMTVDRQFVADLDAARSALSHTIPDGRLETVLHECIRRTLRDVARRRGATDRPRTRATTTANDRPASRAIPAAIRREVWRRDGRRCTFVAADGHRCQSTTRLQLHHRQPFAKGGPHSVENIAVMCAEHNRHLATLDFGSRHVDEAIAARRAAASA